MQRASVEAALDFQPALAGEVRWEDDATLVFQPEQPLSPESELTVSLDTAARSAGGLSLLQPVSLSYRTASYLRLEQSLPEPGSLDVDPTSAVVATFNRPVVALGADPASLSPAFELQPPASGQGEWLNTSTYIFYPEPGLQGGVAYTVAVNPELTGADGAPLETVQDWTFTTASPLLVSMQPAPDLSFVHLDTPITMTFNVPMDAASLQANFALLDPNGNVLEGTPSWNEDYTVFAFRPNQLLERSAGYTVTLAGQAQASGGTPLGVDFRGMLWTVTPLAVSSTDPAPGGQKDIYSGVTLYFNGPIETVDYMDYVSISPEVPNWNGWWNQEDSSLSLYGEFSPETRYTLTISPEMPDPWGGTLGSPYVLNFSIGPLPPQLVIATGSDVLFLTPQDSALSVQAANLSDLPVSVGSLELNQFFGMVSGPNAYNQRQSLRSADERSWSQSLNVSQSRVQPADLYLSPDRGALNPGLYYLRFDVPQERGIGGPYLIVVSHIQVTFKLGATDALVWAVDMRTNQPVPDTLVTLYDPNGQGMVEGRTDSQGVFRTEITALEDPYSTYYAVVGPPAGEDFGMAISTWNQGVSSWDFGLPTDYTGPRLKAYLYTDRPVYRPGQTVYFRAVVRQAFNGRYTLPDLGSLPLSLYRDYSQEVATFDLPISVFGTVHGEYTLPEDARPGAYNLRSSLEEYGISLIFQVAEYRKPEINLQVNFSSPEAQVGDVLRAGVEARYFFDAPADNVSVNWALYAAPSYYSLLDYQVGLVDTSWLDTFRFNFPFDSLGSLVEQGTGFTDAQGMLNLEFTSQDSPMRQLYTLEVSLMDESGFPVSARAETVVHPARFYVGLRSDTWVSQAGEKLGFDVQIADWLQNPGGVHTLQASFDQVEWVREEPAAGYQFFGPTFVPQYTPVGSVDFRTSEAGKARLEFTPPEPGTYMLSVQGEGARSEILVWVGGAGQVVWPNLPNRRLHLVADRSQYKPGDTARVFVPNPFEERALALISIERSVVLRHQVVELDPGGNTLQLPLASEDAPNVYLSVTLLSRDQDGVPDHRQGYIELPVSPLEQVFNVALTSQPQRAGPGDEVTFEIQVTDSAGKPVQGEFSLAVVDLAALALAEPNAPDIAPAFYAEQPLGVRTGITLAAYARRNSVLPAGGGGGDGSMGAEVVRERFPDTAYWNAEIITDAEGRAQVSAALPDNLTTWKVVARGVTSETHVGQAELEIVATKDLLVRPVTPRFLVVGDHVQLSAIVHNNTLDTLDVQVALQATSVDLDDPASATQQVSVPAGGRSSVTWWGSVQDAASADLVFSASAQQAGISYQDAARPELGALPVLRYTAPQTFSTAGTLDEGGERLELISLPRTFDPDGGSLRLELAPSLAGAMMSGLDALEHYRYEGIEMTLARFLPNLETYRALQEFGIDNPAVQTRLDRTLQKGLDRLLAAQNSDGGWGWWSEDPSDPFISAYVLFGLARARLAGVQLSDQAFQNALQYLSASLWTPEMSAEDWQLDRLAFMHFALAQAGSGNLPGAQSLFAVRERLSPWAQALLALTIETLSPGSEQVGTLTSDLAASAVRSATGAHWEEKEPGGRNMGSPQSTTAMVLYALAQREPASPAVAEGVRYLMASRQANGSWKSTFATAWSLMALSEVLRATGELGGEFTYSASLNGAPLVSGQAASSAGPVSSETPLGSLYPDHPNALIVQRDPGTGRLYYTAALEVSRPVEDVAPLQQGISVSRAYYPTGESCTIEACEAVQAARTGDLLRVRVTLTLDQQAYYLFLEDYIPAGAEVLDTSLKTSQQSIPQEAPAEPLYDPRHPFGGGWGWWRFSKPRIFDDHITWAAGFLPAGTYELTYTLVINQPGEYRVLPAHAWQFYFPEVQGNSAGAVFAITPR